MHVQVIRCAQQAALASSHGWCYAPGCAAAGHGGSGNNWALGHNKYGPAMGPALLELVRQQVKPSAAAAELVLCLLLLPHYCSCSAGIEQATAAADVIAGGGV